MKFKCPECRAEVTKEPSDPLGCPCCGYMLERVSNSLSDNLTGTNAYDPRPKVTWSSPSNNCLDLYSVSMG